MERRFYATEVRAEGDAPRIEGYAAVFNELSVVLFGEFREQIDPGAFAATLNGDIRALWNHDTNYPLGRTKAGTLRLAEDERGLRVEIDPPATQAGRDAVESIRRGDVDQMSFAFDVLDSTWDYSEDGMLIRTIRKVKLYEVSPVTFPAYPQTSVAVRADGALGDMPAIPEQFRRAATGNGAEEARARLAVMRRRLDLVEKQLTIGG